MQCYPQTRFKYIIAKDADNKVKATLLVNCIYDIKINQRLIINHPLKHPFWEWFLRNLWYR